MNIQSKYIKYENYVALEEKCAVLSEKLNLTNEIIEFAERANKLVQKEMEKLVQERNTLAADNDKAMEAMKQANEAVKLAHSKYSKLAAENAALKSALNDILQPDAAVLEKNHRVRALDAMETPATDAFLAEVRNEAGARAVELFSQTLGSPYTERDEKCYEDGFTRAIEVVRDVQAPRFAAQLRKGVQS